MSTGENPQPGPAGNVAGRGLNDSAENRKLLSSFFITVLFGVAYTEMVGPVRDSLRADGVTVQACLLTATFFFVSTRFYIGNQLHLLDIVASRVAGLVWLSDLMIITAECVIIIFLAGYCSSAVNHLNGVGFVPILILLYAVDVAWIVSQWVLDRLVGKCSRRSIPWAWARLNAGLLVLTVLFWLFFRDPHDVVSLALLFAINVGGFIVDVVLVDYARAV